MVHQKEEVIAKLIEIDFLNGSFEVIAQSHRRPPTNNKVEAIRRLLNYFNDKIDTLEEQKKQVQEALSACINEERSSAEK